MTVCKKHVKASKDEDCPYCLIITLQKRLDNWRLDYLSLMAENKRHEKMWLNQRLVNDRLQEEINMLWSDR